MFKYSKNFLEQIIRRLALSSNTIDRIGYMNGLRNLKILSLSRNNIKNLTGLEVLGETLEQLWISYNQIEKFKAINTLKKLRVFYFAYNQIKDWAEIAKLNELTSLEEITAYGNPIHERIVGENFSPEPTQPITPLEKQYRREFSIRITHLKKLDGRVFLDKDDDDDDEDTN
jgi:dynein light chain 1